MINLIDMQAPKVVLQVIKKVTVDTYSISDMLQRIHSLNPSSNIVSSFQLSVDAKLMNCCSSECLP